MAADSQRDPGLRRAFWIRNDEFVPIPSAHLNFSSNAEGINIKFAAMHALEHGVRTPPGTPPKLIALDANGITKHLRTIRPPATASGSQAGCSTSTQLHCTTTQQRRRRVRSPRPSCHQRPPPRILLLLPHHQHIQAHPLPASGALRTMHFIHS